MQKTANYNLNQWDAGDAIRREDFNSDNAMIDAALALAGNCKILTGSWAGDGTEPRTVQLPVTPKLLFLFFTYDDGYSPWATLVIATDGFARYFRGFSTSCYGGEPDTIQLNGDILTITKAAWGNRSGQTMNYVVLY